MLRKFVRIQAPAEPPKEFCLIHKGVNESENGSYTFDSKSAETVMKGYKARGVRCMFDWAHASLTDNPVDPRLASRSAGWYDLELRDEELWAVNIEWTEEALEDFRLKRYAYFSPAFEADKSGRVLDYINCALTNLPATHDNEQLVAASRTQKDDEMTLEEALKRIEELEGKLKKMALPPQGDGDDDEDDEEKTETKRSRELNDEIIRLTRENAELRGKNVKTHSAKVKAAIQSGLLTKRQEKWALNNVSAFNSLTDGVDLQVRHEPPSDETEIKTESRTLGESQLAFAASIGVKPEELAK